jgi:Cu(I)/Ag(I) efflux system membrane protein CusA/SilA
MDVMTAVQSANLNVGGKVVEENGAEFVLRGIGLVTSVEDLELVTVKAMEGTPVYLKDIATVQIGGDFRRGALDLNGHEAVGGTVVMRTGENAKAVIERIKEKIAQIAPSLPPGVTIKPFYDRSELIDSTIGTLKHALLEEFILVTLAHIIFLWHFRSILIVTLPLPISILISFLLMKEFGITSNIMSLTGIAIAIGVLVDAAIVVTENVIRHCEEAEHKKGGRLSAQETWDVTLTACTQVGSAHLLRHGDHHPRFRARVCAQRAGRKTVPPARLHQDLRDDRLHTARRHAGARALLAARARPFHSEESNIVMKFLLRLYEPTLNWALNHRKTSSAWQ